MSHQELEDRLRQLSLSGGLVLSPTHSEDKLKHKKPESRGHNLPIEGQLKSTLKEISNINWKDDSGAVDTFKVLLGNTLQTYEQDVDLTVHENRPRTLHKDKIASALIYLKAVAQTPLPKTDNATREDPFWDFVIDPNLPAIYNYMAQFFRYCHKNLMSLSLSGSDVEEIASTSAGFARHQTLGLLQNGVRTVLVFLKRGATAATKDDHNLSASMDCMGVVLCDILNSDGDVGLDIRCGIGLVLSGLVSYRFKGWNKETVNYFEKIYTTSVAGTTASSGGVDLLENVTRTGNKDINRICLGCGILCSLDVEESTKVELSNLMYLILKYMLEFDHGTKESLNLGTARVIEMVMNKICHPTTPTIVLEKVFPLFGLVEVFVFSYIPGHIDAVKNCCRNVLAALTKIYERIEQQQTMQSPGLIQDLLGKILSKDSHVKWIALACVTRNSPLSVKVLNLKQDLPIDLLSAARSCKNPATESYISLMSYDFPLLDRPDWERRWMVPLFTTQSNQNQESLSQKKVIVKSILKCQPTATSLQAIIQPLLKYVINRMDSTSETAKELTESTMLAAETIKIASELGLKIEREKDVQDSDSYRGLIPRSVLHSWLWNEDPQIRLAGAFLLIDTKKTTKAFLLEDFESLKIFLKYNVDSQNPGFRQEFISCFKKLILRLNASQALLKRKGDLQPLENYAKFFEWMWTFFTEDEGLFTGANFGRRCQSLECLSNLVEIFPDLSLFGVQPDNSNLKYLTWFIDSYENNKACALEVLLKIPIPAFEDEARCQSIFDEALSLCESVKPPDSTTGRYLMVLLMKKTTLPAYSPSNILNLLLDKLEKTYATIVATSLTEVSCERPMYGVIRCIRMVLDSTSNYKEEVAVYRTYFEKLIPLLLKFDEVLFPLLGNAAPEGFLPGLPDSSDENSQVVRSITAQMLLVCSWRSMRDICLLFADMCTLFPLEGEKPTKNRTNKEYILSFAQVSLIGEHMLSLMKNLVHRGVFEQVFVGFKVLATRLWESSNPNLCALPSKWLNDAMDEEHMSSKCITRRSAGLPFIFQALLTAECDNPVFMGDWVMRLFRDESRTNTSVRIHAMNVLRGLFRDANFSKAMMPFVPDGLRVAFRGLKSEDWNERNSGLMLYGALIRRTFGPKLNLMSAPTFFRRFPQMYGFLLGELDICLKILNIATSPTTPITNACEIKSTSADTSGDNVYCSDFTFHLLLLLSSFAPAGRVEDEHFKLSEFIVKLRQCAASPDIEVRKLAAKAIIPFLNSPNDYSVMLNIVAEMLESGISKLSINHIHGNLIQMAVIMKYITKDNSEIVILALEKLLTPSYFSSINCPSVFEAVAEVILSFYDFKHCKLREFYNLLLHSYYTKFDTCMITVRNVIPGLLLADATISKGEILFTLSAVNESYLQLSNDNSVSNNLLHDTVHHWLTSYRNATFLKQLLEHLCSEPLGLVDRLFNVLEPRSAILLQTLISCYCKLNISYVGQAELELIFLQLLTKINEDAFENCLHLEDSHELMGLFLDRLTTISTGSCATTEHQRQAMICLCKLSFGTGIKIEEEQMTVLCTTLIAWTGSTVDDDLRFAAALGVPSIPLKSTFVKLSVINQFKIWLAIINLTQDDESEIRNIVNAKVSSDCSSELAGCDRKSLESLVSCFFENAVKSYPLAGLTLLIGLLFKDDFEISAEEANDDDDHEARLFDKSDLNMFCEPIILAKVIKDYTVSQNLVKSFKPIFDEVLPPELIELYELASNGKIFICSPTLSSLLNIITMRLKSDQMKTNSCDSFVCSANNSSMHAVHSQILNMVTDSFL